jgi:hypothetical protein
MNDGDCSVPDCQNPAHARGWCRKHYARWRRYGDPEGRHEYPPPVHGRPSTYNNHHCRCAACTKAWADSHYEYMQRSPEQQKKARQRTERRRLREWASR